MSREIVHSTAEKWLKTLPDNSRDGCVSDFPYGLKFMGKKWDCQLPSKEAISETFRVLKPGAFLFGYSSPRTYHRLACLIEDAGFEIRDCIMWIYGSGFPKSLDISKAFTKIGNDKLAAIWNGWGSCLKPAYEPIVVAMKPIDGTFTQNAEKYGVGGFNIDGCRIEYENQKDFDVATSERPNGANYKLDRGTYSSHSIGITHRGCKDGRYPSNLIVSEETAIEMDNQTGVLNDCVNRMDKVHYGNNGSIISPTHKIGSTTKTYNDIGGASRFFYCAKSSPSDRNYGLTGKKNPHPTVKPIKLTRYVARLIKTPYADAKYINPYSGSGSDMIGFILEGMNVEGCEMEEQSYLIAKERVAHAISEYDKQNTNTELTLFD